MGHHRRQDKRIKGRAFLAKGVMRRCKDRYDDDRGRSGNTRQMLKREIERELRSYE
jgi:hypothetical protein